MSVLGSTHTGMALKYAVERVFAWSRDEAAKVVIVLSDGRSQDAVIKPAFLPHWFFTFLFDFALLLLFFFWFAIICNHFYWCSVISIYCRQLSNSFSSMTAMNKQHCCYVLLIYLFIYIFWCVGFGKLSGLQMTKLQKQV